MMLRYTFSEEAFANRIEQAIKKVLASGLRTKDIAESTTSQESVVGTQAMGDAVLSAL